MILDDAFVLAPKQIFHKAHFLPNWAAFWKRNGDMLERDFLYGSAGDDMQDVELRTSYRKCARQHSDRPGPCARDLAGQASLLKPTGNHDAHFRYSARNDENLIRSPSNAISH
jgi:hypothetical protein